MRVPRENRPEKTKKDETMSNKRLPKRNRLVRKLRRLNDGQDVKSAFTQRAEKLRLMGINNYFMKLRKRMEIKLFLRTRKQRKTEGRGTDKGKYRWTKRLLDGQTDGYTEIQRDGRMYGLTYLWMFSGTYGQTDGQVDRRSEKLPYRCTDRLNG